MGRTVLESINESLHSVMETDDRVYILGEDILDPYGGAFKVTHGLSSKFPDRVLTTPISEAAIVGMGSGMALRGLRPVVEIMFGDFLTLSTDQLVNQAAKFRWMYNDSVRVPLVVRTPMGGRRGYGPTHSQSLEKLFLGIPGLKVVAPNTLGDPGNLLEAAIADDDPVIFIEHKLLYTCPLLESGKDDLADFKIQLFGGIYPNFLLTIPDHPAIFSIATYGYNFELARKVALQLLMEQEIFSEIILFSQLSPFEIDPMFDSLSRTHKLLTIEEGTLSSGWGAELAARSCEGLSDLQVRRVAALDLPIANSHTLENKILPSIDSIKQAALSLVDL